MEHKEIRITIDPAVVTAYPTCREYISARVHQQPMPQKAIAMEMDYSPTTLSRKLAQNENDSQRFTLDDLELYTQKTGDTAGIKYLAAKYLYSSSREAIRTEIEKLKALLDEG